MKLALITATLVAVAAFATSAFLWYQNGLANKRIDLALRSDVNTAARLAVVAGHYLEVPLDEDDSSFAEQYAAMNNSHEALNNLDLILDTIKILDVRHEEDWRAIEDGVQDGIFLLQDLRNHVSTERPLTDAQMADLQGLRTLSSSVDRALSLEAVDPVEFDEQALASVSTLANDFQPRCDQCRAGS